MEKYLNKNLNILIRSQKKNNRGNSIPMSVKFWAKRLLKLLIELIFITWAVFTLVFIIFNLVPDQPMLMTTALSKETPGTPEYEAIAESYRILFHIDGGILNQYIWSIRVLFDGTMGISWTSGNEVSLTFWSRFGTSVTIGFIAMAMSFFIGIPTGIYLARRQNRFSDMLASAISVIAFSIPSFVIALVVLGINAWLGLPIVYQFGNVFMLLMPALVIALPVGFGYTRYLRTSIRNEYGEQYVALARVKGIDESKILTKHILKPALFPIINYLPFLVVGVFFGSITVESVFGIPGTGKMLIDAALEHDQSAILAITFWYTLFTVVSFFVRDLLITFVDPRTRVE